MGWVVAGWRSAPSHKNLLTAALAAVAVDVVVAAEASMHFVAFGGEAAVAVGMGTATAALVGNLEMWSSFAEAETSAG